MYVHMMHMCIRVRRVALRQQGGLQPSQRPSAGGSFQRSCSRLQSKVGLPSRSFTSLCCAAAFAGRPKPYGLVVLVRP